MLPLRMLLRVLLALFLGTLLATPAMAAIGDVTVRLRPHCASIEAGEEGTPLEGIAMVEELCEEFPLYDGETAITHGLRRDDLLLLDIVVSNPSQQPIQSIQTWLEYDATILQGLDVRVSLDFPLIAPGEQVFAAEEGIVKLGASNVQGGMRESEFVFARLQFRVLDIPEQASGIRFHAFNLLGQEGRTKVLIVEEGRTVNILKQRPRDLLLYFGEDPAPTKLPAPTTPPSFPALPTPVTPLLRDGGFQELQPVGLRVMTEADPPGAAQAPQTGRVYLTWPQLSDPRIAGYNIYYGTIPGHYIQRRTVSPETPGVTVRGLPAGQRYYFALTAFSSLEEESEFSPEVSVIVGDPGSSTAPFQLLPPGAVLPPTSRDQGGVLRGDLLREQGLPGESGLPVFLIVGLSVLTLLLWMALRLFRSSSP